MGRIFDFRTMSLLFLLVFITACSSAGETPTALTPTQEPAATESPAPPETPTASESGSTSVPGVGRCENAYYPIREGSTWMYQSTGSPTGSYAFTDTITSVREGSFTLTTQFNGLTRTQEWSCTPEGLVALQLGGAPAAAISAQGAQLELQVNNVSGVTFPGVIETGDQWQHNLEFTGRMNIVDQEGEATGSAQTSFSAIGIESVTVPVGIFDAMKIRVDTTVSISVSFQGLNVPVTFSGSYNYWFVQGVGWVKASGNGDIGGQSFTETIELQAYNIP